MSVKKKQHIARTLYYRDYKIKSPTPFFVKDRTNRFEIFWTPREEEWDEHLLCTYEVPEAYTIEPSFVGEMRDDGRMRVLLTLKYSSVRPISPRPPFELELLILPTEREDGSLHLAVVSAGSQCTAPAKDPTLAKKELDRLIAAIENN